MARQSSPESTANGRLASTPRLVLAMALVSMALLLISMRSHPSVKSDSVQQPRNPDSVELSGEQLSVIDVGTVTERSFPIEREAVGNIDFNEDMAAQVFPPYQGRIVRLLAKVGDNVRRGQILFTVESPDLIQAGSALIAAAGILDLTTHALARAKQLYQVEGIAEKDLQQAVSDQQSAEASLKAARDAVAVFGKTDVEIDRIISARVIDPYLVVPSPIAGLITARNAAPGTFVQPGTAPAPYSVADISHVWLNANVVEGDMPLVHIAQSIRVVVMAFPNREFLGIISTVGATVDPLLHRGLVRAEIADPQHELLPGMFASFVINLGVPVTTAAAPLAGVVRAGDGSMTVWVTSDRHHFTRRIIKIGLQHDGFDQVIEGLRPGEQIVTKGAVYLDNLANGDS